MSEEFSIEDIGTDYKDSISVQDYSKKPSIDDVKIIELKQFIDDSGSFNEILRFGEGKLVEFPEFNLSQVSYSLMDPGAVKAFHLHLKQEDIWFIPPKDKLVVGLFDTRKNSKTYNLKQRLVMGGGKALLLYIPRGVAHGAANLSKKPAQIFYLMNQQFDPEDPDEKRLPWDSLGKDFWKREKG